MYCIKQKYNRKQVLDVIDSIIQTYPKDNQNFVAAVFAIYTTPEDKEVFTVKAVNMENQLYEVLDFLSIRGGGKNGVYHGVPPRNIPFPLFISTFNDVCTIKYGMKLGIDVRTLL